VTDWWPRVALLADDDEIIPGIRVFPAGVHDRGSLAVAVATGRGTVIYPDCAYHNQNLEDRHPIGIAYDLAEAYRSHDRIAEEADLFLAGFDPAHLADFPNGVVA
jgi:glyoxylase-like metal-dependent hydrolase (beta-lactamase superfamily II)